MTRWALLLFGLTMMAGAPAVAAPPPVANDAVDAAEAAKLAWTGARGAQIYAYDQAAWHSSDAVAPELEALARDGAQGWVVEAGEGTRLVVTYYGKDDGGLYALARLSMDGARVDRKDMFARTQREPLSAMAMRLIGAKEAALQQAGTLARCAKAPFNPVLLPPDVPDGPVTVYLLTPQTKSNAYPFGGHYRMEIDSAGKILSSRPFMKSCFEAPNEKKAEVLFLTHLLDPQPTEIHVYMSLWIGKPVVVGTIDNRLMWAVNGAQITLAGKIPSAKD
jgi:hypothetical protein